MPPAGFCNGYDPRAHPRADQSPALHATASRRATGWRILLRGSPTGLSQARGHRTNPTSPHRDDRSSRWLYPNLLDPDTSCRKLVPHKTWIPALCGDRAVTWYERARRMGRAEARLILKGCHPHPLAKASASDKARGAFHHQACRRNRQGVVMPSDDSDRLRRLAAFLTPVPTGPDRTDQRVGSTP
jgi:hypothetical protein